MNPNNSLQPLERPLERPLEQKPLERPLEGPQLPAKIMAAPIHIRIKYIISKNIDNFIQYWNKYFSNPNDANLTIEKIFGGGSFFQSRYIAEPFNRLIWDIHDIDL